MKYPLSVVVPRVVACDCRNICDPPTSTLFMMTLGMTRVTDQISTRFGSASSSRRVMTVCFSALVVSSSGASPVTVTPSAIVPTSSFKSARAVAFALTRMSRTSNGRKPCISPLTV